MRNEFAPGPTNNFDTMSKHSTGGFNGLEGTPEDNQNFYAFIVSMEGQDPIDYTVEGYDSFADAKRDVNSLGSHADAGGHRLEGFVVPASQKAKAEEKLNQKISGGQDNGFPQDGSYWAENTERLFVLIKELYASRIDWNRRLHDHQKVLVAYLMDRQHVPENLARASVHAYNELAEQSIRMRETRLSLLVRAYRQNKDRVFNIQDVKILTDDHGNALTYDQAVEELGREGISLRLNPNLDKAVRIGTADTEANTDVEATSPRTVLL